MMHHVMLNLSLKMQQEVTKTSYMMPSLLMFLYGEEYLVEGITYSGGIKG